MEVTRGRKSKYETDVKPYLDKIREWKKTGATDKQICDVLGISVSTYCEYKKKYSEFSEANKKGVIELCFELKSELVRLAFPHKQETKKHYIKNDTITGHKTQYTEIVTKDIDGDIAAINLLLKNIDKENWSNDPQNLALRKQEFELRKAIAKSEHFDIEV